MITWYTFNTFENGKCWCGIEENDEIKFCSKPIIDKYYSEPKIYLEKNSHNQLFLTLKSHDFNRTYGSEIYIKFYLNLYSSTKDSTIELNEPSIEDKHSVYTINKFGLSYGHCLYEYGNLIISKDKR